MLRHKPVLAQEYYENLPSRFSLSFDGTFGHGGHVEYFLSHLKNDPEKTFLFQDIRVVATDLDDVVMQKGRDFITEFHDKVDLVKSSYAEIAQISQKFGLFDTMLLDLGVNMEHFKDGSRGFSIKMNAELDMRFDQQSDFSAKDIVNGYSGEALAKLLLMYGDFSPKSAEYFAKAIVDGRKKKLISTTFELNDILREKGMNQKKIAVVFQVLRIETNKELVQLENFLRDFPSCLSVGGRCLIMTYHSIEDRITKNVFKELADSGDFRLVHKKVIQPHYTEVEKNKAARSAKLRVIERVK